MQVEGLGFSATDVKQIVTTHLDPDHSGGLPDFPDAEVHVFGRELDAAMEPRLRDRPRYLPAHWKHNPQWVDAMTAKAMSGSASAASASCPTSAARCC